MGTDFFTTVFEGPHTGSYLVPFEFGLKLHTQFNILLKYHSVVCALSHVSRTNILYVFLTSCPPCVLYVLIIRLLLSCVKYSCIENINKSN